MIRSTFELLRLTAKSGYWLPVAGVYGLQRLHALTYMLHVVQTTLHPSMALLLAL